MPTSIAPRTLFTSGALVLLAATALAGCAQPAPQNSATSNSSSASSPTSQSASTPPNTPSSSAVAGPTLCTAAMLTGTTEDAGAGAGHVFMKLVLKNSSDKPCTIDGYPGVSFVGNGNGTQLGAPADRDPSKPSKGPVLLAPGQSAAADLKYSQATNYQSGCSQSPADGLRIYPPSATDALYIAKPLTACTETGVVLLQIGAFTAV